MATSGEHKAVLAEADGPAARESESADDHAAATAGLGAKLATVGSTKVSTAKKAAQAAKPGKAALTKPDSARRHGDEDARPGKGAKLAAAPKAAKAAPGKAAKPATKPAKQSKTAP